MRQDPSPPSRTLTTAQAAARLGVRPATLYAYVSRGLLHARRGPDGRGSRFDPAEVDRLAARGRRAREAPPGLQITTALTAIEGGSLRYRGLPVAELAGVRPFEEVAEWLWSGGFPARASWRADAADVAAGVAAQAGLAPSVSPAVRLRLITAAIAARHERIPAADPAATARAVARGLVPALVDTLPLAGEETGPRARLAERLWSRVCPFPAAPEDVALLDTAMTLLADHELSASTLAVRAVASTRAGLHAAVEAGLAALSGPWHGGAASAVERWLAETAPERVASARGRGAIAPVPGFGHPLYPDGDPRARLLLARLRERPPSPALAAAWALLDAARARGLPPPNVDFALAALVRAGGMTPGASFLIFALARAAGWIAHAMEEYERGALLRPRATYVGVGG